MVWVAPEGDDDAGLGEEEEKLATGMPRMGKEGLWDGKRRAVGWEKKGLWDSPPWSSDAMVT